MNLIYSILVFLISSISMLSGLIVAPIGLAIIAFALILNHKKIDLSRIFDKKIELIFFGWLFLSCIWSISEFSAFTKFSSVLFVFASLIFVIDQRLYENVDRIKTFGVPLATGCFVAIFLFFFENKTNGMLTMMFKGLFKKSHSDGFQLNYLDRGCAVLSMFTWPAMYVLAKKKRWVLIILQTFFTLYLLRISDSLASYLAFALGTLTVICLFIMRSYGVYALMGIVLCTSIAMPIFAYKHLPRDLSYKYENKIPASGKHRLFIWKFTAEKAAEKSIFGWGFDSSHSIPIDEENDVIYYNHHKWNPLPLHPHNNYMQIWLEAGVIGLTLFVLILLRILTLIKNCYLKTKDITLLAFGGGCFINYFFIAMISFGMWQLWWVMTIAMVIFFFTLLSSNLKKQENFIN